jgi:hypothetical protein
MVHAEGKLKPNACLQCIQALATWSKDHKKGRGTSNHNEIFW